MRIEGSRLVVTCRKCGLSVVAVGWHEGEAASDKTALERGSSAAPSGRAMVGGRLELEEGDEPPSGPTPPTFKEYSFDLDVDFENPPVVGPATQPRAEAKIEAKAAPKIEAKAEPKIEPKLRGQGVDEARPPTSPSRPPKTRPQIPSPAQKDIFPGVGASAHSPMRKVVIASSVIALACVLLFFALPTRRTEKALEPRAAPSTPTAAPAAEPKPQAAAQALLPTTPVPAPPPEPRPQVPATARSAPQKPTSKIPAAAAVPAAAAAPDAMSETEALSSGLVNAEVFQDRAGKIMTHILFCRNLELARKPGASLGALDVSLIVSPSGAVSEVRLDRATASSSLGLCLRDHLGRLEFPRWTGRAVEVRRHVDPGAAGTPKAP
ncbi:MAG TPA: hypothetical protein VFZ57_01970 [Thermoanaerobaculia bacterium]|nr:hypothetical protein [Thermoanaerobaculia bacterium]